MNETLCQTSYTTLLTDKGLCSEYVQSNSDSLCVDRDIAIAYSEICGSENQTTTMVEEGNSFDYQGALPQLYMFSAFLVMCFVGYACYVLIDRYLDRKKPISLLKIRFSQDPEGLGKMTSILSSLHNLLAGHRASMEIHKVSDFVDTYIASSSEKVTLAIKNALTGLDSVEFEEIEQDLLENHTKSTIQSYVTTKPYHTLEGELPYPHILNYLSSLHNELTSLLIVFRPVEKKSHILSRISRIERIAHKNGSRITPTQQLDVDSYTSKLNQPLFQVKLFSLADSFEVHQSLSSIIKSSAITNSFSSKNIASNKKNLNNLRIRWIPKENILVNPFRKKFGSYLTSNELAGFFFPTQTDRGTVMTSDTKILESSPDFITPKDSSIHIGTSKLKSGDQTDIYYPIENLERHIYLAGKTGMGKSTLMILLYLELARRTQDKALVMLDPHGSDLIKIAQRMDSWNDLIYLPYNDSEAASTWTFNPLFAFRKSTRQKDSKLEQIMAVFEEESKSKSKDLGTSIEKILSFLIETGLHFADAYYLYLVDVRKLEPNRAEIIVRERQLTLPDLPNILKDGTQYTGILKKIFKDYPEEIGYKWNNELKSYQLNKAILDGVENRFKFIVKPSLAPLFEGHGFDIIDAIENHKRIMIPITEQAFGTTSKKLISKFILAEIWNWTQSIQEEDKRKEAVVFIDEFQEAQLEIIDNLLAQARKYKIRLVLGNQYLGQLWDSIRQSVMGNISTFFAFNMGNMEEAERIPGMFKNKVTAEEIASLPPFQAYLRTLNPENNRDVAFMSFNTIDYRTQIPERHSYEELQRFGVDCVQKYGEPIGLLQKRHLAKLKDAGRYFDSDLD